MAFLPSSVLWYSLVVIEALTVPEPSLTIESYNRKLSESCFSVNDWRVVNAIM
jgi:hypothetical protein